MIDKLMIYEIKGIEKDLLEEGNIPMLTIYLEDQEGMEEIISMEESLMYERQLQKGSKVVIGPDGNLFPLSMAENLGMLDEEQEIPGICLQQQENWQAEWMENYMDALEEMDDLLKPQ